MGKVLIGMPAYNEGKVVGKVVKELKKEGYTEILVVDDASKDGTEEEARKSGATVLRHVLNRGTGAATMTAISYAYENDYDFIVLIDSDGQHSPKDVKKLLKYKDKYDVVIGCREKKDMPFVRRIANKVGNLITWLFFGLYVSDSQSGFKLLNRKAMEKINITYDRYEFSSEIIGDIKRHKLKYKEVPIKTIYTEHSQSKGQSVKNGFVMIVRMFARR